MHLFGLVFSNDRNATYESELSELPSSNQQDQIVARPAAVIYSELGFFLSRLTAERNQRLAPTCNESKQGTAWPRLDIRFHYYGETTLLSVSPFTRALPVLFSVNVYCHCRRLHTFNSTSHSSTLLGPSSFMIFLILLCVVLMSTASGAVNCDASPVSLPIEDIQVVPDISGSFMVGLRATVGSPSQDIVMLPWAYVEHDLTPNEPWR